MTSEFKWYVALKNGEVIGEGESPISEELALEATEIRWSEKDPSTLVAPAESGLPPAINVPIAPVTPPVFPSEAEQAQSAAHVPAEFPPDEEPPTPEAMQ